MPTVTLKDGSSWFYLDPNPHGDDAVLLLHGLGANSKSWQLQLPDLIQAGFRPIAVDFPGFGDSAALQGGLSIARMANGCANLLQFLGINRASVVGISMGGVVALQLALNHPHQVNRLVLANTFACLRPKNIPTWLYYLRRVVVLSISGLPKQANMVAGRIFPHPEQAELRTLLIGEIMRSDPKIYRCAMLALFAYDACRRLTEICMPTLVISGAEDTTVPLSIQSELASGIPGAVRVILDRAGHAASVDQPEAFNQNLVAFLTGRLQPTGSYLLDR